MTLGESLLAVRMRLSGQQQYAAGMQEASAATKEFGTAAETAGAQAKAGAASATAAGAATAKSVSGMKAAGTKMKSTGSALTRGFTVPLALIGGIAIKSSIDFSSAMEMVHTQAGASQKEVDKMTKSVMKFAESGHSAAGPQDLAKGLYMIESAGFRGKRALDALHASEELATVGGTDMEQTSHAVAAAMYTHIKGTKNLTQTVGLLNATVGQGSMRMGDLNSALGTGILDRAAGLGLSLRDVGAALGTLTSAGAPATASATRMAMAFNLMHNPTAKASGAMKDIGLTSTELAQSMEKHGLIPSLKLLKDHLSSLSKVQQGQKISDMFGGGRTSGGIVGLLRHMDGPQGLISKWKAMSGAQKKFEEDLKATNKQPIVQLKKEWAKLQGVFVQLGNTLIPIVIPALKAIGDSLKFVLDAFDKLPGPVKKVVGILLIILAVAGPLLSMFGMMSIGIDALMIAFAGLDVAVLAVPLAIAAVGVALFLAYKKVKWFRDGVDAVVGFLKQHWELIVMIFAGPIIAATAFVVHNWKKIKHAFMDGVHWVMGAIGTLIGFVKSHWGLILAPMTLGTSVAVQYVIDHFSSIVHFITGLPGSIKSAAVGMFDGIKGAFKAAINWIINAWNNLSFHIGGTNVLGVSLPGVTINTPDIPTLAGGGHIVGTGSVLVGEVGPELLHLPRGATVEPLSSPRIGSSTLDPSAGRGSQRNGDTVVHTSVVLDRKVLATAVTRASQDDEARR